MNDERKYLLRYVAIAAVLLVVILGINWLYGHGRVSISMPEGSKFVSISTEDSLDATIFTDENSTSKTLKTGEYQLYVKNESTGETYFKIIEVGRFLSSTSVNAELNQEYGREFIGDEARSCSTISEGNHYSYTCTGAVLGMKYHIPASKTAPTYSKSLNDFVDRVFDGHAPDPPGTIEAILPQNDGSILVLAHQDYNTTGYHNVYRVKINKNSIEYDYEYPVDYLLSLVSYSVTTDGNEIILYESTLGSVWRGTDFKNLTRIDNSFELPGSQKASSFDARQNNFVAVSSVELEEFTDFADTNPETTITLFGENNLSKTLAGAFSKVEFCGSFLCTISNDRLLIIMDLELNELVSIPNTTSFTTNEQGDLYLVNDFGVIRYNPEKLEGHVAFNLAESQIESASLSNSGSNVLVSFYLKGKNRSVLLNQDSASFPDKLIKPMVENIFVSTFSIHKNRVFISAELGDRVYDPVRKVFDYRDEAIDAARESINKSLEESGLVDAGYTVSIPVVDQN